MIDQLIFGGFLVANLAIGLYYGRNVKTLREYALGSRSFSVPLLAATIAATWLTGSGFKYFLRVIGEEGLIAIVALIGDVLALFVVGKLTLRMVELRGSFSIAEALGKIYGKFVRIIVAVGAVLYLTTGIGIQFRVGAEMLKLIFNLDGYWPLLLVALIVTFYAAFGGMDAVVATDLGQFLIISLFIPLMCFAVYKTSTYQGSIGAYVTNLEQFSFSSVLGSFDKAAFSGFHLLYATTAGFFPAIFHRFLLGHKVLVTKKSFWTATAMYLLTVLSIAFLSILVMANSKNKLTDQNILSLIVKKYGHIGFKGLILVGVMSITLSTADSYMNTASVLFANDIIKPLGIKMNLLSVARIACVIIGLVGVPLAVADKATIDLTFLSSTFYLPLVITPLVLFLIGFRTSNRAILGGMLGGELLGLGCKCFKVQLNSSVIGILVNFLIVLAMHYLLGEPGGWVGIKEKAPLIAEKQAKARRWRNFKDKLARFSLFNYFNNQLPKNEITYSLLGMYVMGPVFSGFFGLEHILSQDHNLFYWIAYPMLVLNALLTTYPIWFESWKSKNFITYFFPLSIGFNLFVVPSVLCVVSGYHNLYLLLLILNFLLMLLQVAWPVAVCMALFGLLGAHALLKIAGLPGLHLAVTASSFMMIAYAALLFSCFCIALLRYIMAKNRIASYYYQLVHEHNATTKTLRKLRTTPERFTQQLRDKVTGLEAAVDMSKALGETLRKPKAKQDGKLLTQAFDQLTRHIQDSSRYLNKLFTLVEQGGLLRNKNIALDTFTHKLLNARARDPELHTSLITANQSKAKTVNWDTEKIQNILLKGHKRLQKAHPDQDYFFLHIQDTHLAYPNYPQGLPAVALTLTIEEAAPPVELTYLPPDSILTIASTPYQRQAQQCVSTHYGFFGAQQAPQSYLFVLPKNLKSIRPGSISDTPSKSFSPAMLRKAKAIETNFWSVITKKEYDIPVIEKAVAFMKDAHGHQQRKSGEPYYTHPLTVAQYVSQHNDKQDVLIAALLHDTIEDTDVTPEALKLHFSPRVSEWVNHLSHIEHTFKKYKLSDDQTHSKLENAIHDKEAVLIKLCDRLHNLYTLGAMPKHKQIAKAKETLKVYIPMGKKIGYTQLAQALTRLCEAVLG